MRLRGRALVGVAGLVLVAGMGLPGVTAGSTALAAPTVARARPALAQATPAGLVFTGVAPTRVCDTRPVAASGLSDACTGHPLAGGVPLVVPLPAGVVPATARAVVANVTVTGPSGAGYATVYPTGEAPPPSSNLNFTTGQTVANLVTVATGISAGTPSISIVDSLGTQAVDVIIDVEGYDASPGNTAAGDYHAITPARVADTRCSTSASPPLCGAEQLPTANQADATIGPAGQDLVAVAGVDGVPSSGVAEVAVTLTVVASGAGYATVVPGGSLPAGSSPSTSSINFAPREVVANKVIVPVSSLGTITVFNHAGFTDVIVDVDGWYSDATGPPGATFTPIRPRRLADTRCAASPAPSFCRGEHLPAANVADAAPNGGASITVAVAAPGSPPGSIDAAVLDLVDVNPRSANYVTAYRSDGPLPPTSDVNWDPADTSHVVAGAAYPQASRADGAVKVLNGSSPGSRADIVVDLFGYYSAPPPPDAPSGSAATYEINTSHTDANASSVSSVPALLWTHPQPPGAGHNPAAVSFPLIVNGRVFTVAASPTVAGHLVLEGLQAATGQDLWAPVDIGQNEEQVGSITADSRNVYTASDTAMNGQSGIVIAAYSQATGQRIWSWTDWNEAFSGAPPTVADGVLLIAPLDSGSLTALDPADGAVLWSQPTLNGGDSSPAVVGDTAYVSYVCGNDYAFNIFDGTPVWADLGNCEGGGGETPTASNGRLFLRAEGSQGAGRVLSAGDGALLGSFPYSLVGPAASGNILFLTQAQQTTDGSEAFKIVAEDQTTGRVLWTQSGDGGLNTNPMITNGLVLVGSSKGAVFAFDQATGAEVWQATTGSPVVGTEQGRSAFWGGLAVSGGLLVVPTATGLVAFETP